MSNALVLQIKEGIEKTRPSLKELGMDDKRFAQELEWAIQAFSASDYLAKTDPNTTKNCLVNVALSGLTLNPVMKMAYLVPRKGKCCVDPSYMGLIKVVTDTGSVKAIKAKPVFENEPFEIEQGTGGYVKHGICKTGNKGKRIGAYSVAVLSDGSNHVEWMYEAELMAIKGRSESVKSKKASPWDSDEDEMVRKTVVKRHWKYLPKSERALMASQAIAFDDANNGIDFDAEAQEHERQKQEEATVPGATPDAPFENALATDEDFKTIIKGLDELIQEGVTNLHYSPRVTAERMKTTLLKQQTEGVPLEKDKADKYIELTKQELKIVKEKKQEEGEPK